MSASASFHSPNPAAALTWPTAPIFFGRLPQTRAKSASRSKLPSGSLVLAATMLGERQRIARDGELAVFAQRVDSRVAGRQGRFQVDGGREQRADDRVAVRVPARPVRRDQHAGAVGDEDHQAIDGGERLVEGDGAGGAAAPTPALLVGRS